MKPYIVLTFSPSTGHNWPVDTIARCSTFPDALHAAHLWLDHQTRGAAAILDCRPKATSVDFAVVGFAPLDITAQIYQAAQHYHTGPLLTPPSGP